MILKNWTRVVVFVFPWIVEFTLIIFHVYVDLEVLFSQVEFYRILFF